jgi:hypothetical protein
MNKKARAFVQIVLGIIVITFFAMTLVAFPLRFIGETNPNSEIITEGSLSNSYYSMNSSLKNLENMKDNIQAQLSGAKVTPADYIFLIFQGAFEIPKTMFSFVVSGVVSISELFTGGLVADSGISMVITTGVSILFAGIIIIIVIAVIKFIRGNDAER